MHAFPYHSKVRNLEIVMLPISSASQLGDQFTKGLPQEAFERRRMALMAW
jgi:hypothetical protein